MDNPQHYQPLSRALDPPFSATLPPSGPTYSAAPNMFVSRHHPIPRQHRPEPEEEEEEEDDDDDDEGLVEEQLSRSDPDHTGAKSTPASPRLPYPSGSSGGNESQQGHHPQRQSHHSTQARDQPQQNPSHESETKRRPGRPRGSKNRKSRTGQTPAKQDAPTFQYQAPPPPPQPQGSAPPPHPDINAQNQQYYEFQWRVLHLCKEFYGAAEELVKGTSPLVMAQCYEMGPSSKVDPLSMLAEAKRICDSLLANPSRLIGNPHPPPLYHMIPQLYQPQSVPSGTPSSSVSAPTSSIKPVTTSSAPVITNPQSFVVPLTVQPTTPATPAAAAAAAAANAAYHNAHAQYGVYPNTSGPAPPGQYAAPYYQYPFATTPYYPPPQPAMSSLQPPQAAAPPSLPPIQAPPSSANSANNSASAAAGNQGAWSDEEVERLKKLADQSKSIGSTGEMEWDWVVHQWGAGRTRHQILIKATSLGLKESSSRGTKRRRETEGGTSEGASPSVQPPTPTTMNTMTTSSNPTHINTNMSSNNNTASPAQSHTASTPAASPALPNQSRPVPTPTSGTSTSSQSVHKARPGSSAGAPTLPWPMPTVAANTPSPVVAAATIGGNSDQHRNKYYRPRPNESAQQQSSSVKHSSTHSTTHSYMYQPNGSSSRLGSKENGK